MSVKIEAQFVDGLRILAKHIPSGVSIETDPPIDNGGSGKSYSPTDLLATAVLTCMFSIMALHAKKQGWSLLGLKGYVEKHMTTDLPRKVAKLFVFVTLPSELSATARTELIDRANNCPVLLSLSSGIDVVKQYH